MAIAVESVSTGAWQTGTTLTLTKPTGLSVGDCMFAVISTFPDGAPATPAGWTQSYADNNSGAYLTLLSKIADSSDVAASDFSFTHSTTAIAGVLYRMSGAGGFDTSATLKQAISGGELETWTGSITPTNDDSALIIASTSHPLSGTDFGVTDYAISGTNPTWTERLDSTTTIITDGNMSSADTILATSREITSFSVRRSGTDNATDSIIALFIISPVVDVTVSADQLTLTANIQAPTVSADSNVSVGVQSLTFSLPAPTVTTQTVDWTYEARPAESVWTIEEQ